MREQNMNNVQHGPETADAPDPARVRELNDRFRRSFAGGHVALTAGVAALPDRVRGAVITAVQAFDAFDQSDNDPYSEHDFGALTVEGERLYFKIDYYDRSMRLSSPDAADPAVTVRSLVIMLATEY